MARPKLQTSRHLRRTKLVAAFTVSALAGIGSYSTTYYVLARISEPAAVVGAASPPAAQSHGDLSAVVSPAPRPAP
jgi:hypothetical protein